MSLTWRIVDNWREDRGMTRADLARRAGIPERTIYSGIRKDARLQAATTKVISGIFPDKFSEQGEGVHG